MASRGFLSLFLRSYVHNPDVTSKMVLIFGRAIGLYTGSLVASACAQESKKTESHAPKESYVQRQILEYLALKRIFHYRNNSSAFKRDDGHFYRFGAKSSPDIICIVDGRYVGMR